MPFSGPGVSGNALVSRNRHDEKIQGDGDSQEGIIRQDDYEVSYFHNDSTDRETGGEEGYGRYR